MEKNGKGKELYDRLTEYKQRVALVLQSSGYSNTIPINLAVPASSLDNTKKYTNDAAGWTNSHFYMTPTIAATAILSKLQNDVKNAESQMIDYCYQQIGAVKLIYDEFQAFAQTNASYAMPGDEIEITAGIGAFSKAARPEIYIDGKLMPVGEDGVATWKTIATGEGRKTVDIEILFFKPDGTRDRSSKQIVYEVARPAGVAVSPNKMNVLYIGVVNPVTITAGKGSEKVNATFSGGKISRTGGNQWSVIPEKPGEHNINVTVDNKTTSVKFRVRKLPDPYAYVGDRRGGAMKSSEFKVQGGVIAKLESEFDAEYTVISYKLGVLNNGYYEQAFNEGSLWAGNAKRLIDAARPGTVVFFDEIKVRGPGGIEATLPQMSFNLK